MTASQLVGNTWSFKPIMFEETLIFMINITLTIPITIITSMRTKPPTVNIMSLKNDDNDIGNKIEWLAGKYVLNSFDYKNYMTKSYLNYI